MSAAKSSTYGYYVYMPATINDADEPLNSCHVQYMTNNILHLNDMSTQHRYNWVSAVGGVGILGGAVAADTYYLVTSVYFPVSMSRTGQLENLVVRIGAKTDKGTVTIKAILQRADKPAEYFGDTANNIAELSDTTTSTTGEWVIQDYTSQDYGLAQSPASNETRAYAAKPWLTSVYTEPSGTGTYWETAELPMYRLSIYISSSVTETTVTLLGISIREFHDQ
jgi:hypothetical protein